MGIISRLFGRDKRTREMMTSSQIRFGEATKILKFVPGSERRFQNQIEFLRAAVKEKKYPYLSVISLKKSNLSASCDHLIIATGSREQFREIDDKDAEDIFQRVHSGKSMEDMWSDGVVADTPDPGYALTDIRPFNELRDEIVDGWYEVDEVIQEVAIDEKALSDADCSHCQVKLLIDTEVEKKYAGTTVTSSPMDYLAEMERAKNAIGVACAVCGKGFCVGCMQSHGKPHPQSGGLACLACGGQMTRFQG